MDDEVVDNDEASNEVTRFHSPPSVLRSVSPCSSGASTCSNVSSIRSFSSKGTKHTRRSNVLDELRSDVPTITESIADMQDIFDDDICSVASSSQNRWPGSCTSQAPIVDSRSHPFAPVVCVPDSQQVSRNPIIGDPRLCADDIPSIRDDVSVISAPSDIHVNFSNREDAHKSPKRTRSGLTSSSSGKYECSSPLAPSAQYMEWRTSRKRLNSNAGQSAAIRGSSASSSTIATNPSASDHSSAGSVTSSNCALME